MKALRKTIAFLLVMAMTLSCVGVFANETIQNAKETVTFTDIEENSTVGKAVSKLVAASIISGYPDGTFKPDGQITRAEFATVIAKFSNLPITLELDVVTGFEDLDNDAQNEWARPYVKAAAGAGIINGFEDGSFRASESVTYEQAVKMIICAIGEQELADSILEVLKAAEVEAATWSSGYIGAANRKNITAFATVEDITAPATRGTVAVLVANALTAAETDKSEPGEKTEEEEKDDVTVKGEEPVEEEPVERKTMKILSFGNSYSQDSFTFLRTIGAAAGYDIYMAIMYKGGCPLSTHYSYMNGEGLYPQMYEYFPDGTTKTTNDVSFLDGLTKDGHKWDYITLHQKGEYSPFYEKYYTPENPYITGLANYIRKNSPGSEVLMFENWSVYTDRIIERYDSVYGVLLNGYTEADYIDVVFKEIKSNYIKAAKQIGNPRRIIPVGEAVYRAITKYGFEEYVKAPESTAENVVFDKVARAMYRDNSSHLTFFHGRVLAALTWFEYLTGEDVRENPYQHKDIPEEDMALLKEIAHEVCSLPEYQGKNK